MITIPADARECIARYTDLKCEVTMRDGMTPHEREDLRSYAVEALLFILCANPEAFDYQARIDAVRAQKRGEK